MNKLSLWLKSNENSSEIVSKARSQLKQAQIEKSANEFELERAKFSRKKHIRDQNLQIDDAKLWMFNLFKEKPELSPQTFSQVENAKFRKQLVDLAPSDYKKIIRQCHLHFLIEHIDDRAFKGTKYSALELLKQLLP